MGARQRCLFLLWRSCVWGWGYLGSLLVCATKPDKSVISNWYSGSGYHIEQFKTADGKTLLDSQVNNLVEAMAAFAPPAAGQSTLAADYQTALNPVIAANWQ